MNTAFLKLLCPNRLTARIRYLIRGLSSNQAGSCLISCRVLHVISSSTDAAQFLLPYFRYNLPHLPRINEGRVTAQLRHWQQESLKASLDVDPRTCRSQGASIHLYIDGQQGDRQRDGVFGHASTSQRTYELLRFRLKCHTLPSVSGRSAEIPRFERLCPVCVGDVGDEKHLVFECSALNNTHPS